MISVTLTKGLDAGLRITFGDKNLLIHDYMKDNCKVLSSELRDQVAVLVKNWRNKANGSMKASIFVQSQVKGLREMSEDEKNKALAEYFERIILVSSEEGQEVKIPNANGMDKLLIDEQNRIEQERLQKQEDLDKIPVFIGLEDYSQDFELTDILNRDVKMSSKKRRNALAAIVERHLRRELKDDYSEDVHGKLVNILRGNAYNGTVDTLYTAALMAARTEADGSPLLTEDLFKKVLSGDEQAIRNMNGIFESKGFNQGKQYTALESRLMREVVGLYMKQNKAANELLMQNKNREIRSAATASRHQRVLAQALRTLRKEQDSEVFDLSDMENQKSTIRGPKFTITREMLDMAELFLKEWADKQDKDFIKREFNTHEYVGSDDVYVYEGNPFDGVAEYLWNFIGDEAEALNPQQFVWSMMAGFIQQDVLIARDKHGNIIRIDQTAFSTISTDHFLKTYFPEDSFERDEDGQLKGLWTSEQVTQMLTMCYSAALSRGNLGDDVVRLYDSLKKTEGRELVVGNMLFPGMNTSLLPEIIPILEDLREKLVVDQAQDNEERAEQEQDEEDVVLSEEMREARNMTTTACAVEYDSKKLRARTEAIVYGMMERAKSLRWMEATKSDQRLGEVIAELKEAKQSLEYWKKESHKYKKGTSEKAAAEAGIDTNAKKIEDLTREHDFLVKYLRDLHDDTQFFPAVLKNNMQTIIDNGQKFVLGEGLGTGTYVDKETSTARRVINELTVRALAVLEERSGVHIIYNRKTMQFDVQDDNQHDEDDQQHDDNSRIDGALREDEDEGTVMMKDKDMDFRDDIDPFAHLSTNVRFFLSMFVKKDFEGNPIIDDIGNYQFWNPKDIYTGLMDIFDGLVVEPEDMYRITKDLNGTDKICKGLHRRSGRAVGHDRTEQEAYPKGKPIFDILERNRDKYPWVSDLIEALQEDWMSWATPKNMLMEKARPGMLTTNLFTQLGHVFMRRMQVKDGMMNVTNETNDAQNAKATQRHNYYTGAVLANKKGESLPMLWSTERDKDKEALYGKEGLIADQVADLAYQLMQSIDFEAYKQGMMHGLGKQGERDTISYHAERLTDLFRGMGLDIEYGTVEAILRNGNKTSIQRVRNLLRYCNYAATNIKYARGRGEDVDIYEDNFHNWKKIYELAGPLVRKSAYITSTTENGKTRQNYILPNSFTTKLDTLGYGGTPLRKADKEGNAFKTGYNDSGVDTSVIERRREKIDREFRNIPGMFNEDTGKYNDTLLQQFYEGNLDVGQYMQGDNLDGKDYRTLSATEQLIMQLAAFEHPKENNEGKHQLEYVQFASMADVPLAQFVSVDYGRGIYGAIDAIAGRVLREHDIIQRHRNNRKPYVLARAVALKKVRKDNTGYYDSVDGSWVEANADVKDELEYIKLFQDYLDSNKDPKIKRKITNYQKKHPDVVQRTRIEDEEQFQKWAAWVPRDGYFSWELRYGELPDLNRIKLTAGRIMGLVEENYAHRLEAAKKAESKAEIEAEREQTVRMIMDIMEGTGRDGSGEMLISELINDFVTDSNDSEFRMAMETARKEIAKVYVAVGMKRRFNSYMQSLRVPFRQYSEKANMHRIERALRREPDYDGEFWSVETNDEGTLQLRNEDTGAIQELNEAEAAFYNKRMNGWNTSVTKKKFDAKADPNDMMYPADLEATMLSYFKGKKSGEVAGSEGTVHKFETILNFVPPIQDYDEVKSVIQNRRSTSFKKQKVSYEDVFDSIERLFYHTYAANTELMELFGIRANQFKSPEDLTKRLKMLYSNGLRLDTNRGNQTEEHFIIVSDYDTQISDDLPNLMQIFYDELIDSDLSASQIEAKVNEYKAKLMAYTRINATDAQGHLVLDSYEQKASQAGSTYMSTRQEETVAQLRDGTPQLEDYDQSSSLGTIKQKGADMMQDVDPDGNTELVPVFIKNSEAVLLSSDVVPNQPVSAQMTAIERYVSNTEFADGSRIQSIQRPSGVKTQKKGIIALHYVDERVSAIGKLASKSTTTDAEADAFVKEWASEVDNVMELTPDLVKAFSLIARSAANGRNPEFLTFEDIDKHVHNEISVQLERFLRTKPSEAGKREVILNGIKNMQNLMTFMTPCKATERTLGRLHDKINDSVMNDDGSMNEQFVMTISRKYQHMQIRPTNHSYDAKAHLGSQMSYIMQTAIDFDKMYEVADKGELSGKEVYYKFNQVLAQRLLFGLREAGAKFKDLHELRNFMINIIQNNPKYGPEMVRALDIVTRSIDGKTKPAFATPLSSVAVIYKVSDILTSIIRGKTHRRPVSGANVVIEADTMYDDRLSIRRDENGKLVGVECYLPAWSKELLQHFLKTGKRKRVVGGIEVTEDYQYLDSEGLEKSGLAKMIGYRIPTEDIHSMLPLIVKDFLPQHRGSSIVVAKEITTLTGGDNDIDKLFLMIKRINKEALNEGRLEPVDYDFETPVEEQSEEALENMLIDLTNALLTDPSNEARYFAPQSPASYTDYATEIAHNSLPYEQQMKIDKSTGNLVYRPDDPNWNNNDFYEIPGEERSPSAKGLQQMDEYIDSLSERSVFDLGDMVYFRNLHALAKLGVAIAADNTSTFSKVMAGAEYVKAQMRFKTDGWSRLPSGITIDGQPLTSYCPRYDVAGGSAYENCSNFAATLVDSGNSPDVWRLGITLENASLAAFFLRCGLTPEMMAYMVNILANTKGFKRRYNTLYKKLTKDSEDGSEAGKLAHYKDFGSFTMADLKRAQRLAAHGGLMNEDRLANDTGLMSVLHVMNYLMSVHDNIQPWTKTLKMNSVKHALSNEPASAVYSQLLVEEVERNAAEGKYLVDIPQSMVIHPNLNAEQVAYGKFTNANGTESDSGVQMVQAYYTCGIEAFNKVMDKQLFYAHPAFQALVRTFSETIMNLPKDDAVSFIKQLHDEFSTFYLSGTPMMKSEGKEGDTDVDRYIKTRNYYRDQFPQEIKRTLKDGTEMKGKYAILRVLRVDDSGKLVIDDDMLSDTGIVDVRDSLVKMAKSNVKAERDMAKDIFLNAFFTDGLRFGYGSVSKVFTPSFLADDAFSEYNEEIEKLCFDRMVTGDDLANFAQQFIRNNYNSKKFTFGPLIRAVGGAVKNDEGDWVSVQSAEDLQLNDNEVSYQDVRDLEQWLTRKENNGKLRLDATDVLSRNGKVQHAVPTRIIEMVDKLNLKQGDVFRMQTSFSTYEQNLYMIDTDADGTQCIIKLNDILSTKKYSRDMDFRQLAAADCSVGPRGKVGDVWAQRLTGSMMKRNEMRKAFLNGGISEFLKNINERNKKRREREQRRQGYEPEAESVVVDTESFVVGGDSTGSVVVGSEYVSAEEYMDNGMNANGLLDSEFSADKKQDDEAKKRQPKRASYKGGKTTNISMEGDEIDEVRGYRQTEEEEDSDQMTQFFQTDNGPFMQLMVDEDGTSNDENIEDRMADVLNEHGAVKVYNTQREAIDMAAQINGAQNEFIAVAEAVDSGGYKVTLGKADDTRFQQLWIDQYAAATMTGPRGINTVMNKISSTSGTDFIALDTERAAEDYRNEVEELIDLINAVHGNKKFPPVTDYTARDIIRKMRHHVKVNGFFSNLKRLLYDAANGDQDATQALFGALGVDETPIMLGRLTDVETLDDPRLEREAEMLVVRMLSNHENVLRILNNHSGSSKWLAGRMETQLMAGIMEEFKAKLSKDDINRLDGIMRDSVANTGNLSEAQRERLEAQNRRVNGDLNEADRMLDIMEAALQMEEQKRKMKVEEGQDVTDSNERIEVLDAIIGTEQSGPNLSGVINYLNSLLKEYRFCANVFESIQSNTRQQNLDNLSRVKRILASHEELLEALTALMEDRRFADKFNDVQLPAGETASTTVRRLVGTLGRAHRTMRDQYAQQASSEFIEFVKEFVGEDDTVTLATGETMTWAQLLEQYDGDISFIDKWLRSMGDTEDPIGQIYNRVVQRQKDKARMQAINDQQGEIKALNDFVLNHKITDFEFLFEHDENGHKTGYYLTDVENGKFYAELEQKQAERDEVLNDRHSTKEQRDEANKQYQRWFDTHAAVDNTGHITPNRSMYASAAYEKLRRENSDLFDFLGKFLELKRKYDERLGAHTNNNRAIQRRMTSEQRFKANFTLNPKEFWENTKRRLAQDYLVQEDDYMEAGEESALLNFDGTRRMLMPAPYVRMLKNPDELSTDPIGCLVAYSYATANYQAMREIANPLEVGFDAMLEGRIQYEEKNGRRVREDFRRSAKKRAVVKQSRFFEKLRSFLDSQLYMRYIEDGDDTFKVFGKEFRKSKTVNAFLHMSAVAQLGFNWLVDIANLANGLLQTNIEAAARRFFRGSTLRQADIEYTKALADFIPDLSNPIKQSKLALVGEKLNIMQNFDVKVYNNRRNNLMSKLFNTSVAFLGTSCGNHWLYNRVAIAMMLETEVELPDGSKTNLWEAFETVTNEHGGKTVRIKPGAKVDGQEITDTFLSDFGRQIAKVNHSLLGIYNRDDMVMAQKLSMTKLLIAFRKHVVVMMDKRYRKRHRVAEFAGTDQEWQEGYMRTLWHFLQGLKEAEYKIPAAWDNLTEYEKQNVRMAITDIVQWAALMLLMSLIGFDDDNEEGEEEGHLKKICKFLLAREAHEMGSMLPTLYMPKEGINMMNQPFMGTSQIESVYNFCSTAMQPWTWDERVQAGPFKGQSQIEMRFRRLPIPILSYYRNLDKSLNGVDNSTWFYNRGYVGNSRGK